MNFNLITTKWMNYKRNSGNVQKQDNTLTISTKKETSLFVYRNLFKTKSNGLEVSFFGESSANQAKLKLLNRKRQVIAEFDINTKNYLPKQCTYFIAVLYIKGSGRTKITDLSIKEVNTANDFLAEYLNGDERNVLLSPGYPNQNNKYFFGFVHSKVRAYKSNNLDLAVITSSNSQTISIYEFEGVKVLNVDLFNMRRILRKRLFQTIIIHFANESFIHLLNGIDLSKSKVYLYSHGGDTLYRDSNILTTPYFTKVPPFEELPRFRILDNLFERLNDQENVTFVFPTHASLKRAQTLNNICYNRSKVIPCIIDEEIFQYAPKNIELRKNIYSIRHYNDIQSYATDINVRVVLALSKKLFFSDLTFSFYGDGLIHEKILAPIAHFQNVHIHKHFLSHHEIAEVQKNNGICLIATRYDNQGVSACEAAMGGVVVLSSNGFFNGMKTLISEKDGIYCDVENIEAYCNEIEKLYRNPDYFSEKSKSMHDAILDTASYSKTVGLELELFSESSQIENYWSKNITFIENSSQSFVLSIIVPSYNVSEYLNRTLKSIYAHPHAKFIETIVVNDGSKDDTSNVAYQIALEINTLLEMNCVRIIDKENGGHGSTINRGIKEASGTYTKVLDGDDYFDSIYLEKLVLNLFKSDQDLILTEYVEDWADKGTKNIKELYFFLEEGKTYNIDDLCYEGYGFGEWGPLLSTSTVKTEILKALPFQLDENCFYVDMEFNAYVFAATETIAYFNLPIYQYLLGNVNQSVSQTSFIRNWQHHEKVLKSIITNTYTNTPLSTLKKTYILNKIVLKLTEAQYYIALTLRKDKIAFNSIDSFLKQYPEIYNHPINNKREIKIARKSKGLLVKPYFIASKLKYLIKRK